MDTDIGTELFSGYENDFKLIVADISSKLQGLQDQDGEPRKSALAPPGSRTDLDNPVFIRRISSCS
jgi:hypothetical protein